MSQSLRDTLDVNVAIHEDKKCLVFGFQSRHVIANVLTFYGYRHESMQLMQVLSHGARAYIWNADCLQGFLKQFEVLHFLKQAEKQGELEVVTKWQVIDLKDIEEELEGGNFKQQMKHLNVYYPCLFLFTLQKLKKKELIEKYMTRCQALQGDCKKYSYYVHGYFLIFLQRKREAGLLKKGMQEYQNS